MKVGSKVRIENPQSGFHKKIGKIAWSNADGTEHEIDFGKGQDGKSNTYGFASKHLKLVESVGDEKYPDSEKGAMDALANMSTVKRQHMTHATPGVSQGHWVVHSKHPKYGKSRHSVYLAGHGIHRNTDFETLDEAVEDETKKYYEPKAPGEKAFWTKHVVRKYTQPDIPKSQFDGGTKKDHSRKADVVDLRTENPLPELPSYLNNIKKVLSGVKEETDLSESDDMFGRNVAKAKKSLEDHGWEYHRTLLGPTSKHKTHIYRHDDFKGEAAVRVNPRGPVGVSIHPGEYSDSVRGAYATQTGLNKALKSLKEDLAAAAPNDEPDEKDGVDDAATQNSVSGSELKQQLEQVALQAAEIYAEVQEKNSFDGEMKEAIESAVEAIGKIYSVVITAGEEGEEDSGNDQSKDKFSEKKKPSSDDGDEDDDDDATNTPKKKKKNPFVKEEEISEISKELAARYIKRATERLMK